MKKHYLLIFTLLIFILSIRHIYCNMGEYHIPDYPRTNISNLLKSESKAEKDYLVLYRQTGLSPVAIDNICKKKEFDVALMLQDLMFEKPEIKRKYILYPLTSEERTKGRSIPFADLRDGDILVTFNTSTLDWRHGHCAMVADAKNGLILEHRAAGEKSCLMSSEFWSDYPSFAVLRYTDSKTASKAAQYAKNHLIGVDYSMLAGIFKKDKSDEALPSRSNCSHIVWQAYKYAGVDLDRDKGFSVTPGNIAYSEKLKVVQVFAMDTDDFEKRLAKQH